LSTHTDALANVYARSLFELATQGGGHDMVLEVADELEQICELTRQDRAISVFFSSPVIDESSREASLKSIFTDRVTSLTLRFLLVLNNKGRLNHLEMITTAYDQLVQDEFGKIEVDVFTPIPLDTESIQVIKDKMSKILGKEPILHPYIEEGMIGGIKLRIGDQLLDGSVSTKLRRISESIQSGGSMAIREHFETYLEEDNN